MPFSKIQNTDRQTFDELHWNPKNVVEIEQKNLESLVDRICRQCRYPFLTLRILLYVFANIDADGSIHISARQLSKKLDVHYDTVTKSLKYLREIGFLTFDR